MSLAEYIAAAPKTDLHLHLQGAVQPATLLELANRHNISLPVERVEDLAAWFQFRDFAHFAEIQAILRSCLTDPADLELVAYELGAELARQNVGYAEVSFTPGPEVWFSAYRHTFFDGLARGRQRVLRDFDVEMNWIFDIPRRTVTRYPNDPLIDFATKAAIDGKADGVVALGLAGTEFGYPPERFEPWFERARAAGLHSAPHAGEFDGPASIRGALEALGAERIGHGVRAVEDPALVEHLVERGVPLEVCLTSNVRLGVYATLAEHSLPELLKAGVAVTINTDTPAIFGVDIITELLLLASHFGLDRDGIDGVLRNGIRASFASAERKRALEARLLGVAQA